LEALPDHPFHLAGDSGSESILFGMSIQS